MTEDKAMKKPTWEKEFTCGCEHHKITFTYYKDKKHSYFDTLVVCIEEHKSGKTGKIFKKSRFQGDVVINGRSKIKSIINGIGKGIK